MPLHVNATQWQPNEQTLLQGPSFAVQLVHSKGAGSTESTSEMTAQ